MELFGQQETPLYEYSDAKIELEMQRGPSGRKRTLFRIYIYLVMLALFAWLLYSLIAMSIAEGFGQAIVSHIGTLFTFIAGELILFLTATGKWGAFARLSVRSPTVNRRDASVRILAEEVEAAEANKPHENAVRIYLDNIVIINGGTKHVLPRADIEKIACLRTAEGLRFSFRLRGEELVSADIVLPVSDFPLLRKYLGGMELMRDANLSAPPRKGIRRIVLLLPSIILFAAGIALLVLHFTAGIPWQACVLLFLFAMPFFFMALNDFPIVRGGILPLATGVTFIGLPIFIATLVITLAETSLLGLLSAFTPVHMILAVFCAVGGICIFSGIQGVIDSVRWHLE